MSEQHTISAIAASNGINYLIDDVSKSSVSVDNVKADINMLHISQASYAQLVAADEVLSNALYVVSADYIDAFGEQIKNLAPGTDLSDAVNLEQLLSGLDTKQPAGNYLTAVPDDYKTYSNTASLLSSDGYVVSSLLGYELVTATGTLSSGSYVYDISDRTITTIGINLSSTPVIVRLPDAGTRARDFIVRVEISSSSAPSFTFTNAAGLDFESDDDDWAVMEPGLNIVSFTETKR